jgi:hypothetical protein
MFKWLDRGTVFTLTLPRDFQPLRTLPRFANHFFGLGISTSRPWGLKETGEVATLTGGRRTRPS